MEGEKPNYWAYSAKILSASLIIGAFVVSSKFSKLEKTIKNKDIEFENLDSTRLNEYNNLLKEKLFVLSENSKKDSTITGLNEENKELKKDLYFTNIQYDTKAAQYQSALDSIEDLTRDLGNEKCVNAELENYLKQNSFDINEMLKDISSLEKSVKSYNELLKAKEDTVNLLQDYVNAYTINRRPLNEKSWDKVFLPEGKRYLPETREKVKEIRALNKGYLKK